MFRDLRPGPVAFECSFLSVSLRAYEPCRLPHRDICLWRQTSGLKRFCLDGPRRAAWRGETLDGRLSRAGQTRALSVGLSDQGHSSAGATTGMRTT